MAVQPKPPSVAVARNARRLKPLDFVETYRNDAIMNGLNFDIHQEEEAVEMFAKNIMDAGKRFLDNPMEAPFVPSWNRVVSAMPDVFERLKEAVELDNEEYS